MSMNCKACHTAAVSGGIDGIEKLAGKLSSLQSGMSIRIPSVQAGDTLSLPTDISSGIALNK